MSRGVYVIRCAASLQYYRPDLFVRRACRTLILKIMRCSFDLLRILKMGRLKYFVIVIRFANICAIGVSGHLFVAFLVYLALPGYLGRFFANEIIGVLQTKKNVRKNSAIKKCLF